jgi:uncharacterized protein YecT (DUF1311 family)
MRLALATALVLFTTAPAFAKLPLNPVKIAIKHKEYEVAVAYPQTGNKTVDAAIAGWAKGEITSFKSDAAGNADDNSIGPNTLDISFKVARNDSRMFAVVFTESTFEGGAHPNTNFRTMNFLMPDGWQVYLPEIFTQTGLKKISERAIADLDRQLAGPDSMSDKDWIARGAGPDWDNFSDFVLMPDRLDIQYAPYNVAAYAAGPQETKLPLAPLKPFLRANWRAPVASFDCAKAATPVEKTICSNVSLARQDRYVAAAYEQLMAGTDANAKRSQRDKQRAFLAGRTKTCGRQTGAAAIACLTRLYGAQLKVLSAPAQ